MGDALTAEGEYAQAVVAYDRALSAGDVPAEVHHGRARALTLSGKWKEARSALSDYLSKEEHDLGTWFELGRLAESVGDLALAEKAYEKASGIQGAAFAHARVLSLLGEDSPALVQIQDLLARNPGDIEYLRFAAFLFLKMGRYEEAIDAFSRALQKREDDHMLAWGYASALESGGRYHDAVEAYTKLLKADPDNKTTMYVIGSLLTHLGQYRDAGRQFDRLLEEHPEDIAAIIRRGFVAERLGKFAEALEWYEKALSIDSKNGALWSVRGSILVNLSRFNDALKSFDRAIDLSQNEVNAGIVKGSFSHMWAKKSRQWPVLTISPKMNQTMHSPGIRSHGFMTVSVIGRKQCGACNRLSRSILISEHHAYPDYRCWPGERGMAEGRDQGSHPPSCSLREGHDHRSA